MIYMIGVKANQYNHLFFDTGTNMTNCSFPYDEENKMTYPMQLRLLTRPSGSTRSNAEDYHIESDVLDLQFENYIKDESEFEKIKEKWDGFEYDCWTTVSAYSGTFHRKDCTYGIKLWLWIAYNFYPVTILFALLCLFGAIWARSLQILQFIFATLLTYTSHKALSIKKITRVKTWLSPQYWNTPTAASSWSSVGLIGLFTRQSKEQQKSKRRQIIWFSFFFSVVIFVGYFLGPNIWNRLSLKANFNNSDLTNTVVLTLVLMQVFHFIALAFTPYPGKCTWKNDASFVNMIGVVIPCHRSADEIGRTLESILKNGIKPEHIIVVDNAHSPVSPDDTQDRVQAYAGVQYIYLPIGHKSNALFTGIQALPTTVKYIMHIDDDTVLPSNMIFDPSHFNTSPAICAISYGISCFRHGTIECLVDFELALWSHWRLYRAQHAATAWFCHGIVGLWRRQCLEAAFAQHPFLPFGEDGWLGAIAMAHGWVIKQELRSSVLTFAPPRLLPPLLPKQIYERSLTAKSRVQGYGAASVWKQRSRRWFVNAPRRLFHILLLFLGYTSENASLCADFFFRVEIVRHVVITLVIIIYPLFILRVIYDGSWIDIIILKGVLFVLDIALYGGINYLLWYHRPELQVSLKTVLLYPFYRTFLRFAYVVAHWSCLLDYIPFYPMRTAQFFNTAPLDFTPNLQCFLVWCWQRAFFPPEPLDIDYVQVQSDKEQQLE
uniref:Glycosyltransferase 2-like domain-containing protein n=1 Tax=Aureoumbra lagunensis TaxID=44058 RepID=A0A7S3NPZ6_9STRA